MNSQEEFLKKLEAFCETEGYFIICTDEDASMSLIPASERRSDEHYQFLERYSFKQKKYVVTKDFDLISGKEGW